MSNRMSDPPGPPFSLAGNPPPMMDKYYNKVNVEPLTFTLNDKENTQFFINLDGNMYVFDPLAGTWMIVEMAPTLPTEISSLKYSILKIISLPLWSTTGYDGSYQTKKAIVYAQRLVGGFYQAPEMYELTPRYYSTTAQNAYVRFPAEEISFGRDITIDGVYVLIAGAPGITIGFSIDGWQRDQNGVSSFVVGAYNGSLTIDSNAAPGLYLEYQVYDVNGVAITLKAPQLRMFVNPQSTWTDYTPLYPYPVHSQPYIKCAKVAMFGSFDPNQRPV